jgi:hypothetical protein
VSVVPDGVVVKDAPVKSVESKVTPAVRPSLVLLPVATVVSETVFPEALAVMTLAESALILLANAAAIVAGVSSPAQETVSLWAVLVWPGSFTLTVAVPKSEIWLEGANDEWLKWVVS